MSAGVGLSVDHPQNAADAVHGARTANKGRVVRNMAKISIDLSFSSEGIEEKSYKKSLDVENDLDREGWDYLAAHMFLECQRETLYRTHRQDLPKFEGLVDASEWSPSQAAVSDLTRWAAHTNTAEVWFQIQNIFFETAHLLAQSRAYNDIETEEADEDRRLVIHLVKSSFSIRRHT